MNSIKTLVIATHNAGKLREISALLCAFGVEGIAASSLNLGEPEETGASFEENAAIKALAAAKMSGFSALSDDSGLCVEALDDKPGIHSARWAGENKDFAQAMRNIEEELQKNGATTPESRRARFVAVLCLAHPWGETRFFHGICQGTLVWPPRGTKGFGYDPVFLPVGHERTFGEMSAEEKHSLDLQTLSGRSHRARAFGSFAAECLK